jgi:hypothetical protein
LIDEHRQRFEVEPTCGVLNKYGGKLTQTHLGSPGYARHHCVHCEMRN